MSEVDKPFEIPEHWNWARLSDFAEVNPRFQRDNLAEDTEVSFVPMKRVEELSGQMDPSETKPLGEVRKGYTYFENGDVLFAKITPCMENGKVAVARGLQNGVGFGSTEFHVIRHPDKTTQDWIFYYLIQEGFRRDAKRAMTGSAGQKRVPTRYIEETLIPLPPLPEQRRIVAKIEELFSNLDAGMGELSVAEQQLKRYRLSVLQAAVEGRLTADWRRTHDPEPADQLLERILEERRAQWEERYRWKRYDSKGKKPPSGWKDRYKEPESPDTEDLSAPPEGWIWITLEQLGEWTGGNTPRRSNDAYWEAGTIPWVSPKDMKSEEITDTKDYMTELALQEANASQVGDGSLLFVTRSGILRHTLPVAIARVQVTINQDLKALQLTPSVNSDYLLRWAQGKNQAIRLDCMKHGTTVQSIKSKALYRYPVPLPPLAEQKQIVAEVERLLSVADDASATTKQEQTRAERLRQSILKQAFSGKLVPHEAEHSAPETPPTPAARVGEQMEMGL